MKLNLKYLTSTIILFLIEVSIATVFKDVVWLRAYFGDVLVVVLIYTFILSFFNIQNIDKLIFWIFLFSCSIELAQHFHFGELLGFKNNRWIMVVLGNSFSWIDIACYFVGCLSAYIFEIASKKYRNNLRHIS